jgi:hypothetical protein
MNRTLDKKTWGNAAKKTELSAAQHGLMADQIQLGLEALYFLPYQHAQQKFTNPFLIHQAHNFMINVHDNVYLIFKIRFSPALYSFVFSSLFTSLWV